jgi:hypothetical protein
MANAITGTEFLPVRLASTQTITDTTLVDITGFVFDGLAGRAYEIDAVIIHFPTTAEDGFKFAVSGSATFTDIRLTMESIFWSTPGYQVVDQLVTKDTAVGATPAAPETVTTFIHGTLVVNAAGTVKLQVAQNVNTTGTLNVVAGSVFEYQLVQ